MEIFGCFQLAAFRTLYFDDNFEKEMMNNFRPTQHLNGRFIYTSVPTERTPLRRRRLLSQKVNKNFKYEHI